jgi:hypothetical protein
MPLEALARLEFFSAGWALAYLFFVIWYSPRRSTADIALHHSDRSA